MDDFKEDQAGCQEAEDISDLERSIRNEFSRFVHVARTWGAEGLIYLLGAIRVYNGNVLGYIASCGNDNSKNIHRAWDWGTGSIKAVARAISDPKKISIIDGLIQYFLDNSSIDDSTFFAWLEFEEGRLARERLKNPDSYTARNKPSWLGNDYVHSDYRKVCALIQRIGDDYQGRSEKYGQSSANPLPFVPSMSSLSPLQ